MLTQALLGFLPDAPRNKLYIDPFLPRWLPDLTVYDVRVGKHKVAIRFWREEKQTAFEVIRGDAKLVERCELVSKFAQLRTGSDPTGNKLSLISGTFAQLLSRSEVDLCCVHQRQVLRRGIRHRSELKQACAKE